MGGGPSNVARNATFRGRFQSVVNLENPEGYALSYETGLRTLDLQASDLRELRARAGRLLSAAALILSAATFGVTLLSNIWTKDGESLSAIGCLGWIGVTLAVGGFLGVFAAGWVIWKPAENQFMQDPGTIVHSYVEGPQQSNIAQIHRELALWFSQQMKTHNEMLSKKTRCFELGLYALAFELGGVACLLVDQIIG